MVQAVPGIFLWPLLVKTWYFTTSKEDSGTQSYGIPTRQGNYEIFPRDDQLPQQVQCTQCTPHSTPQCTHTSGCGIQTTDNPTDGCFQEGTWCMPNPEGESHVLCFQGSYKDSTKLPEFGERGTWNYLGNGKVPLLPVWKGIHIGNQSEATCKYLQEAYD